MIILLMGVSGSGKTTLGTRLAEKLGLSFLEGDDLHSRENKAKMGSGVPLEDEDRWPWLQAITDEMKMRTAAHGGTVVACSALKKKYRDLLLQAGPIRWVYLKGDQDLIRARMESRQGHFMDPRLLESQFALLEEPAGAIVVDIAQDPDKLVQIVLDKLKET